jgi:hypothetical protein
MGGPRGVRPFQVHTGGYIASRLYTRVGRLGWCWVYRIYLSHLVGCHVRCAQADPFDLGPVNIHGLVFIFACATVVVAPFFLYATRGVENRSSHFLVVQIFFEILSFPVLKRLLAQFSCTGETVIKNGLEFKSFCQLPPTAVRLHRNAWL